MNEDKNKRIVRNTGVLYFRSFICLLLSLYSSRLILQALGVEDFGIYNAVGGLASMFWMVSSTLSSAVGRFLNFEMGRENHEGLNEVFSLSLNILIILALVAALLAEGLGMWFLNSKMTIPTERMGAAKVIFHLSVLTMVTGFIAIPFNAAIAAHERMGFIAAVNIVETVLKLGVALLLTYAVQSLDKLIVYAVLLAVISFLVASSSAVFGRVSFSECRLRLILKTRRLWEMVRFSFWNFIASITGTFSGQGVNMVLNVYRGPILNTARGLTGTVSSAVSLLVFNFTVSLNPQITQSYAAGDITRCRNLVLTGTRFAAFLMLLMIIPLCIETDFVMTLWLGSFPEHTLSFVRLSLIAAMLYVFINQFSVAKMATGNIWKYQLAISVLSFLDFVLAWVVLSLGMIPEWIYITPLVVVVFKIIISIGSVRKSLVFSMRDVILKLLGPVFLVVVVALPLPVLLYLFMPQGWIRFILVLFTSLTCTGLAAFFFGSNRSDREILRGYAISFLSRFGWKYVAGKSENV